MEHAITCREVARTIQTSPAFEFHGCQISTSLHEFRDKLITADTSLRNMFDRCSIVCESFETEIETMMEFMKRKGDTQYFKKRVEKLLIKIKELRRLVEKSHRLILDAKGNNHNIEGNIENGLSEAENFCYNNERYLADIDKAKEKLVIVEDSLDNLHDISHLLTKMKAILMRYEEKLLMITPEVNGDNTFEVTRDDLNSLNSAIEKLKTCHYKFAQRCEEI
ncbi:4587_t:CDS:1 [Funneliformis caledonium]|uniref:4587_t:CDS:1 n=1 Tax=Funneliformis caledonium TaxID=1117310 RepID=A0A9N9AB89_9GLOM|nr:4587_t:CDS:1 [Funneliformis caledonium]